MSRWTGRTGATRWYSLLVGIFFLVRAATTLAAGASFTLPGDGWRSLFQLAAVATLTLGLLRPRATAVTVAIVAATYTLATLLEAVHGTDLLGVIPVDQRDRFVHPLIALLGIGCLALARQPRTITRRRRTVN